MPADGRAGGASADGSLAQPFAEQLADAERLEGLLTFHIDRKQGKVWLELPAKQALPAREGLVGEYLYVEGLVTGLGSNPIGLDRGQLGPTRLVSLRRLGNRLLVEEQNLGFRALSDDSLERAATRESFANSVLWAGEIEHETPDGRGLVDFTSFLVRDAHGVSRQLDRADQGKYRLDEARSAVDFSNCLAFVDNLEFEALLTFVSDSPGRLVSETAPLGEAFGLVLHHSLIRLPDDGYRPRRFDPRAGSFAIGFQDYAAGLDESIEKRWIVRHRLARTGPDTEIVYYVDPGAPEPVRSALIEGASWWAEAFEAAGFPEAYRVELLPANVHPLDIRYNVIQWVHRSTRGWSYGGGVIDPRTGEMIKGHVNLGSLRVRQDRVIFEGLLGAGKTGSGDPDDPVELALARIRQLAAHEVGHTLGFAHNFAASTYGRASVMDYPAPMIRIAEGELDASEAYAVGAGAWDIHAARYAYTQFADERDSEDAIEIETAGLASLIREGHEQGLSFLSDRDARPAGAAQPAASLWDNGADAAEELANELAVRQIALSRFGVDNIAEGTPLALLEEVLAPVYFHHRYQLEAAIKMVGGLDYGYPVRGDGRAGVTPLPAADQRRALKVVLAALAPERLDLPESVLALLSPRPFGYEPNRELFSHRTSPAFDSVGAAGTAADLVIRGLLQPERAARLADQGRRSLDLPDFEDVTDELLRAVLLWKSGEEGPGGRLIEIGREVERVLVKRLIELAGNAEAAGSVRAQAEYVLRTILESFSAPSLDRTAHEAFVRSWVQRFLDRGVVDETGGPAAPEIPPGSPIGAELAGCSVGSSPGWLGGGKQ